MSGEASSDQRIGRWFVSRRKRQSRIETNQLIASEVDFCRALQVATDDERAAIESGKHSSRIMDQISAAVMVRLVLGDRMPHDELVRYVQHLQGRYQSIVGTATYARYFGQVAKDIFDDKQKLKAELHTLSYRLRLAYSIAYIKDAYLSRIRRYCFTALFLSFAFVISMIVIQVYRDRPSAIVNFLVVAFMGFGGALTSISRRANQIIAACPLDDDPIVESSAIQNGWWSLLVAALTGPIFAMILLVIFITHSFSLGEMTPRFVDCAKCTDYDFEIMNYKVCFLDYTDAAKTVFWSFLAGFAEQLVPDVLDRFTKASAKKG